MIVRLCFLMLVFWMIPTTGFSADLHVLLQRQLQQEVDQYITELNESKGNALAEVADRISGSGLSDSQLFDTVNALLISKHEANMTVAAKDKAVIHQIGALLRTLASSGNPGYASTLESVLHESKNRAIRNRAKHVLAKIDFYHNRNLLMQNMENHRENQSLHATRILNLLQSDDLTMSRFAAEEIVRQGSAETAIQDWLAERVQQQVRQTSSNLEVDTVAWYCKVLGTVNKAKYADMLTKISHDKSVDPKIRRHIKKILRT
jgi:hypothetical protein